MNIATYKLFQILSDGVVVKAHHYQNILFEKQCQKHPQRYFGFICVGAYSYTPLRCELRKTARHCEFKKVANDNTTVFFFYNKAKQSSCSYFAAKLENFNNFKPIMKGNYLCP
jgi:hypothetical protein